MSLKRQFALLIAGILVIPFLTIAISIGIFQLSSAGEKIVFDLRKDSTLIEHWLASDRSELLSGLSNENIVILDEAGNVLYGQREELKLSELTAKFDAVSLWLGPENRPAQVMYFFKKNSVGELNRAPLTLILVPSFLLLFVALMSVWIVRTIQTRLRVLVSATQRIGLGDFTTEIAVQGSDELANFSQSLDVMRLQLKQAGEDRKRLLMGISHDLKTPLSGIKGYVHAILDGLATDDKKRSQYLNIIADKTNLLEQRIASLIEYVKLESADWSLEPSEVKVQTLTQQWFDEFENDVSVAGFSCQKINDMPHGTSCQFDSALVRRALDNLISNAMKYSKKETNITLLAQLKQAHYCFVVENEGEEFSEQEKSKLFNPFFRGDKGRNTEGIGLGLTVVEKVTQLHGGRTEYSFRDGRHRFTLMIPLI